MSFVHFLLGVFGLIWFGFFLQLYWVLFTFWLFLAHYHMLGLQIFSPNLWVIYSVNGFFSYFRVFWFDIILLCLILVVCLACICFDDISRESLFRSIVWLFPPHFSSSFIVSQLTFKSFIYFWAGFFFLNIYACDVGSSVTIWQADVQFSQHHLVNRLLFPYCVFLAS